MTEQDWLLEQLKTVKNLCEVAVLLRYQNRLDLLPTILELMYQEIQAIVDENCIAGEAK